VGLLLVPWLLLVQLADPFDGTMTVDGEAVTLADASCRSAGICRARLQGRRNASGGCRRRSRWEPWRASWRCFPRKLAPRARSV